SELVHVQRQHAAGGINKGYHESAAMFTMKRKIMSTLSRSAACLVVCCALGARVAAGQTITLSARSIQPGEVVRVEVQGPGELEGVAASVFGRHIPLEF